MVEVAVGEPGHQAGTRRLSDLLVDVDLYVAERGGRTAAPTEEGKLLLEVYSGGTFKKSMNYHRCKEMT